MRDRIDVLLAEYDSLNALLLFRLTAMDRRLPATVGFMAAAIASVLALPTDLRVVVLIATPAAILWSNRTTIQHARAKEDHLRRIAEIEQQVNSIAGEELMRFQSRHPNRAAIVAGRTGRSIIFATTISSLLMLTLCGFLFRSGTGLVPLPLYLTYLGAIVVDIVVGLIQLDRYAYRPREPGILLGRGPVNHTHRV